MEIVPFEEHHIPGLVESWNRWTNDTHQIDIRLLKQLTFEHPGWNNNRSYLNLRDSEILAFILARDFQGSMVVDALMVAPEMRRQGIGSTLLGTLGEGECRMGGGAAHFLPGIPEGDDQAIHFFEKHGFNRDWTADDLRMTLGTREPKFVCSSPSDKKAVLEFVASEFSTRWTNDTRARFERGDANDLLTIKENERVIAFCHTWHHQSRMLGPSVFWLRNEVETFGGIGPVGVKESERGRGLGREIVLQALNYLASKGVTEVVVDWTSIGPFYEKCGFRPWRRYLGYKRS